MGANPFLDSADVEPWSWLLTREDRVKHMAQGLCGARVTPRHLCSEKQVTSVAAPSARSGPFCWQHDLHGDGWVYFAATADPFAVKIGYTNRTPEARVAEHQGSCPSPIVLVAERVGRKAMETVLHKRLQRYRMAGGGKEWFDFRGVAEVVPELWPFREAMMIDRLMAAFNATCEGAPFASAAPPPVSELRPTAEIVLLAHERGRVEPELSTEELLAAAGWPSP